MDYLFSPVIQLAAPQDKPHRNASLMVARGLGLELGLAAVVVLLMGLSRGGMSTASHHRIKVPDKESEGECR